MVLIGEEGHLVDGQIWKRSMCVRDILLAEGMNTQVHLVREKGMLVSADTSGGSEVSELEINR